MTGVRVMEQLKSRIIMKGLFFFLPYAYALEGRIFWGITQEKVGPRRLASRFAQGDRDPIIMFIVLTRFIIQ